MLRAPHRSAIALSIAGLLSMLACGGSSPSPALSASNDVVDFGEVDVGGSVARAVTVTNTTTSPLDITDVITSGAGVITSGRALPFRLQPGESTRLFVEMAPTTSGNLSGTVSLQSATTADVTLIRTSGKVRLADQLAASPATVAFGDVAVGARASQDVTLTNRGTQDVTVTSLSASTAGVSITGLALPATFAPGQSATLTLAFAPAVAGGVSGSIAAKAETGRPASVVAVSGSGVSPAAPVTLAASPARVDFRDVTVGSFSTQGVTLTNSSAQQVTISELVTTGTGFTATGIAPATVLAPGASATVSVKYTPAAVGAAAGQVAVRTASQTEPLAVVDLVGNGVAAASITSVSVRNATAQTSGTVQMVADVVAVGTIDRSVTWTLEAGSSGSIDATTGVYSAPSTPGTYQVRATSKADPTKSAVGAVTVSAPAPVTPPPPATTPGDIGACTGLVADGSARRAGALALPAYNASNPSSASIIDPVFGTKITRVTGNPGDSIPNTGAAWRTDKPYAGPVYSKDSPWNADQSVLAIKAGVNGQTLFVDGNTYVPLYTRSNVKPEYRWHPTDPRYMIYVDASGQAGYFEPATNTYTVKFNPGSGFNSCTIGSYEGNVSYDGRLVVIQCLASGVTGDAAFVFFAADLQTGTKYPTIRAIDLGFSGANTSDHQPLDWASISPLGNYIVASQDWQQQRVITLDGRPVSQWGAMGHYDLGVDASGAEVAYNGGSPDYRRLSDGAAISLPWPGGSQAYHSSTRDNRELGWGYSSLEGTTATLDGEIVAHELSANGRIRRLAHHRATNASYDRAAFAAVSPDGTRVLFRSDWGNSSGPAYGFVVDIRNVCP